MTMETEDDPVQLLRETRVACLENAGLALLRFLVG